MKHDILSEIDMSVIEGTELQEVLMSNIKISTALCRAVLIEHNPDCS